MKTGKLRQRKQLTQRTRPGNGRLGQGWRLGDLGTTFSGVALPSCVLASLLHPPCGALLVMLLLVVSAPSLLALSHPPPLDQPHQQGVGSKGWASGFPLPLHQENVQGWINNVCCRHSIEEGPL